MTSEVLFKIWDRFDISDVSEVVFETSEGKVELKRAGHYKGVKKNVNVLAGEPVQKASQKEFSTSDQEAPELKDDDSEEEYILKAPLVGTFYRAASPQDEPFVTPGKRVKKGDVIGIIEAMKLMNEITAPCDGVIKHIYAEDGTLVEFDQKILGIGELNDQ